MTIYDDITRLQNLGEADSLATHHMQQVVDAIYSRVDAAIAVVSGDSPFIQELREIKGVALEEQSRIARLNDALSQVILSEARRLLGGAG